MTFLLICVLRSNKYAFYTFRKVMTNANESILKNANTNLMTDIKEN